MTNEQIMKELIEFRDERGWDKYHNLKDLAISLNLEASELLEIFQWKESNSNLTVEEKTELKGELADVLIYAFYICNKLKVSPTEIIHTKVLTNKNRTWDTESEDNGRNK